MCMNKKNSIVTVSYNAVATIESTILSVINQTYSNVEYIIIDGGSTDGTVDIIKKYQDKISYWISEPDQGIYDAMNKGLKIASGEWINFMNSGDSFVHTEVLENLQLEQYDRRIVALYGDTIYVRPRGEELLKSRLPNFLLRNMPTSHQSFFVRTENAKMIGFDVKYKYDADYNMMYQLLGKYGMQSIKYLPQTIARYDVCIGLTISHRNAVFREVLRIRKFDLWWIWDFMKYIILMLCPYFVKK